MSMDAQLKVSFGEKQDQKALIPIALLNDRSIALEIGVFWRGASLWTPISGRWDVADNRSMDRWIGE